MDGTSDTGIVYCGKSRNSVDESIGHLHIVANTLSDRYISEPAFQSMLISYSLCTINDSRYSKIAQIKARKMRPIFHFEVDLTQK
jgi:hypothetical protein